ncbi:MULTISPECIES: transferrin-binding protein-like solute binding protein [Eikenella]|uniref:transferrin-binding protein-like solute binding protein n=1 Tax=Eikenella TaxID=538 RepID=UPI0009EE342F|nr:MULTISPECIES: transferrin-binding protein-like solute binding protein [Eikenella]
MKRLILSLSAAAVLAGCAGNGGVAIPDGTAPVPPLTPIDQNKISGASPSADIPTTFQTGNGELRRVRFAGSYSDQFIYQAPDGKSYAFDRFTNPPDFSAPSIPDKTQPTKITPQATANGSKLLVCCENTNSSLPAGYVLSMRYGVWIGSDGQIDMFAGGIPAPVEDMQKRSGSTVPTGKATYEVWAFRVKEGNVVTSSYNTSRDNGVRSLLTVNFNTGKVGGTIKGNTDFGADINFDDVRVNGNTFSGNATSNGINGQVDGGFYGKSDWYDPAGTEIGGKITFGNRPDLNSVFGGTTRDDRRDQDTTSTDLNPINP